MNERINEIWRAADSEYEKASNEIKALLKGAFYTGAQWADQHPVNPWHDASKELPKVDERHKYVLVVVARPDNRVHFACYSHAGFFVNESFYGEFEINDVKYWMPIPELLKEE